VAGEKRGRPECGNSLKIIVGPPSKGHERDARPTQKRGCSNIAFMNDSVLNPTSTDCGNLSFEISSLASYECIACKQLLVIKCSHKEICTACLIHVVQARYALAHPRVCRTWAQILVDERATCSHGFGYLEFSSAPLTYTYTSNLLVK
jgi:hypothetical protein